MTWAIEVSNLAAGYGARNILEKINFAVAPGQNLGIIGPNGSGKSTLLRCIIGNIAPIKGLVRIKDRDLTSWSRKNLARTLAVCGCTSQRLQYFSTLQYVLIGRFPWLSWLGQYSHEDKRIAASALRECGLDAINATPVVQLSSGQFQLTALARTLAQIWDIPEAILVFDELTANLDLARKMDISLVLDKWQRKGHTIVQASHDCNLAALFCTHLLGLKNGRQIFFGSVKEVFTKENLSVLYDWPVEIYQHPDAHLPQIFVRLPGNSIFHTHAGGSNLR